MRPAVYVAGIAAAAAATGFLFPRWQQRRLERQQRERSVDVGVQTALTEDLQEPVASAPTPATDHEDTSVLNEAPMENQRSVLPFRIQHGSCRGIQRSERKFIHRSSDSYFDGEKIVNVSLYHISVYNGLNSYHRWICIKNFHHPYPELCPKHYARVKSSVGITRHGCQVKKTEACNHTTLTSVSLVQGNTLLKKTTKSHNHVVVEEDGSCWSTENSERQAVEVPVITPSYTGPFSDFFH